MPTLPLAPALDFMRGIWGVNHAMERVSKRMEQQLGITAQQRMMIRWIGQSPGIVPSVLAEQLRVDAGTVSTTVARLEKRRLVSRKPDPDDGRRVTLWLSAHGRALDVSTPGTIEHGVALLLNSLSEKDVNIARRVLALLTKALEDEAIFTTATRGKPRRIRRTP